MFFHAWLLRSFLISVFFLPLDLLDLARWFGLLLAVLEIARPELTLFVDDPEDDWDEEE